MKWSIRRCLHNVAVWIRDLCNVLGLKNPIYNWDWYSLIWFAWICMLLRVWACVFSPIAALTMSWHIFWLHAMLGPWLAHCKSSWSCMNWNMSPKIYALRKLFFLMRPWYVHWHGAWRSQLCGTNGTWTNYLTCSVLLDVGIMIILRRADW